MSERRTRDRGQAAVEFAVVLPVVLVAVLGVVVVAVAVRNEVAVEFAAREGARAAAVSANPSTAAAGAVRRATSLPVDVATSVESGTVTVRVTYTDPIDVALVGHLVGPVTHTAAATMALEPP